MINTTYRPLTATERDELAVPADRFSPGCLGVIIIYGLYLIAIACVGAVIGTLLRWFGVSRAIANGCGFALGTVLAVLHFVRRRQAENAVLAQYDQRRQTALSRGVIQIVQFEVHQAWSIGDLEDFGPGYLFDVESDQFVYARTQQLLRRSDLPIETALSG